ncbi:MAG: hypothetical protein M3Q14_03405 [bacterium]|nr:hypothetical protein [bacterium]
MDSFILLGMQFSIIASVILVAVAYIVLTCATAIWYLVDYTKHSLHHGTSSLAAYTDNTSSVLQASKLHNRKVA